MRGAGKLERGGGEEQGGGEGGEQESSCALSQVHKSSGDQCLSGGRALT